jgi:hypothetical protein
MPILGRRPRNILYWNFKGVEEGRLYKIIFYVNVKKQKYFFSYFSKVANVTTRQRLDEWFRFYYLQMGLVIVDNSSVM